MENECLANIDDGALEYLNKKYAKGETITIQTINAFIKSCDRKLNGCTENTKNKILAIIQNIITNQVIDDSILISLLYKYLNYGGKYSNICDALHINSKNYSLYTIYKIFTIFSNIDCLKFYIPNPDLSWNDLGIFKYCIVYPNTTFCYKIMQILVSSNIVIKQKFTDEFIPFFKYQKNNSEKIKLLYQLLPLSKDTLFSLVKHDLCNESYYTLCISKGILKISDIFDITCYIDEKNRLHILSIFESYNIYPTVEELNKLLEIAKIFDTVHKKFIDALCKTITTITCFTCLFSKDFDIQIIEYIVNACNENKLHIDKKILPYLCKRSLKNDEKIENLRLSLFNTLDMQSENDAKILQQLIEKSVYFGDEIMFSYINSKPEIYDSPYIFLDKNKLILNSIETQSTYIVKEILNTLKAEPIIAYSKNLTIDVLNILLSYGLQLNMDVYDKIFYAKLNIDLSVYGLNDVEHIYKLCCKHNFYPEIYKNLVSKKFIKHDEILKNIETRILNCKNIIDKIEKNKIIPTSKMYYAAVATTDLCKRKHRTGDIIVDYLEKNYGFVPCIAAMLGIDNETTRRSYFARIEELHNLPLELMQSFPVLNFDVNEDC